VFELKIALKYLLPKKKSLSSALISLMSVVVISLVVWLVLVFLSVTSGIEKNWVKKLTAMHAPVRISPTSEYYNSYYYQVDALSAASNYTYKTIGEKEESPFSDPYSPEIDPEVPYYIPSADKNESGELKDPVKGAFTTLKQIQEEMPDLAFQDYEIGGALMRLSLKNSSSSLSQMAFLLSIPDQNPHLRSLLIPASPDTPLDFKEEPPLPIPYAHFVDGELKLPNLSSDLVPVIIPKNYKENGVQIGDRGTFSYSSFSAVSMQEQKIPFAVVGFYDPGIMAVGNKCFLVPKEITRNIHASTQTFSPDGTPTNGIFVWTDHLSQADAIAEKIEKTLEAAGFSPYWKVTTYKNFEFAKDLLGQFQSDKTLLLMIAAIILIVACCNIISLLVLLVNDKKKEIAILQSMGASFKSIAAIFGSCGIIMGTISCMIGSLLAVMTLHHLESIVQFLSLIQGRKAFNPAFFGDSLPNSLSYEALLFVLIATPLISLLAGLIPAIKASRIRPSSTLRAE
jgi:lipoprotein-releasing system permease protein